MKLKESLIFTSFGFTLAIIAFITFNSHLTKSTNLERAIQVQKSSINFDEIAHWANNIPALKTQDEKRSSILSPFMENFYKIEKPSEEEIREIFYQVLSQPMQTVCNVPKKIGGKNDYHCHTYHYAPQVGQNINPHFSLRRNYACRI